VELEALDNAIWEKKNELWVVPKEHKLEVLRQHYEQDIREDTELKS